MKFSKTGNTLQVVGRLDPGQVGLNEVLSVILDVLDDAKRETGIADFSQLAKNDEAVSKWLAICRAFLGVGIDRDAVLLSDKKREKIEALTATLRDKDRELERITNETENMNLQLFSLQRDMDELQAEREKNADTEKRVRSLERDIAALRQDLESYAVHDPAELEEKIRELKTQKERAAELTAQMRAAEAELGQSSQAYRTLVLQTRELEEGLSKVNADIASENAKQESLSGRIESGKAQLEETKRRTEELSEENRALVETKIPEAQRSLDKMLEDNGQYFSNLQALQNDINTKKTLLQESTGELDAVKKLLEDLRRSTEQARVDIESEKENRIRAEERYNSLNEELSELRANVGAVISKNEELSDELIPNTQKRLEVLKENRDELSANLVSLDQQVAEVDLDIKSLQENMTQEENKLAEKREEVEDAHRKIEAVSQQRKAEEDALAELNIQLESLQEHIELDKANGVDLQNQLVKQRVMLKTQKERNDEMLNSIVDAKTELEKCENTFAALEAELADWQSQKDASDGRAEEMRTRILEAKAILDEVNLKIEQLDGEQQRLIGEINARRKMLEESKPELLQEQLSDLEKEYADKTARAAMLQNELNEQRQKLEAGEASLTALTEELEGVVNRCAGLMAEKQAAENEKESKNALLESLQNDLNEYKAFLASADYAALEKRVEACRRAKTSCEAGLKNLLGTAIPPQFLRTEGKRILEDYNRRLSEQLQVAEEKVRTLYAGYINVIKNLEKEVNQYAL